MVPGSPVFTSVRRARRSRASRIARTVAVVGVVAVVAVAGLGVALWQYAVHTLAAADLPALADAAPADGRPRSVLVVAHRGGELDLVAVAQVGPRRDPPVALTFPADLKVVPPGQDPAPLAEVWPSGGTELLADTVEDYTGIALDHFVEVDLAGLDAIAELTGTRVADAAGDGDERARLTAHLGRIRAAAEPLSGAGTWLRPLRAKRLVEVVAEHVRTDVDLGLGDLAATATALAAADPGRLDVRTVPGYFDPEAGVVSAYPERAETLFDAFRRGAELPADLGAADPHDDELVPSRVRVRVLNGVGIAGIAGAVADRLTAAGFAVVEVGNAETFDQNLRATTIGYGAGARPRAELLARHLEGAELVELAPGPAGADVVVTVAADQAGDGTGP